MSEENDIYPQGNAENNSSKKKLPNIQGFRWNVKLKYDTERYTRTENKRLEYFNKKWNINFIKLMLVQVCV